MDGIMPLKPIKNIDQEVQFPKGLEFRADVVWNKIETKKEQHLPKAMFFWIAAASVAFLLSLFLFGDSKEILLDDNQLVTGRSKKEVNFDLKIERPTFSISEAKPVEIENKEKPDLEKFEVSEEIISNEKSKPLTETSNLKNQVHLIKELEEKDENPKKLSPAALHLQKSLAKLDKDKSADQIVLVQKFDLLNELNVGRVQASTTTLPNSVFQSIKKESNERN